MFTRKKDSKTKEQRLKMAVEKLRAQSPVLIENNGKKTALIAAEFLDAPVADSRLIITSARAKALGFPVASSAASVDVKNLSASDIIALADPTKLLSDAPPAIMSAPDAAPYLSLAKRAGLLPALLMADAQGDADMSYDELVAALTEHSAEVFETARAKLPLAGAENSSIISFREAGGDGVHLALVIGTIAKDSTPLVRVHSSCVTGDLLGSLRCDCGDQLSLALEQIKTAGNGILLYLNQEGRGIGITNKLRAYQLQERGFDTYEANVMLGFDEDERDFATAAAMLKALGIATIQLLSNNPQKIESLTKHGISIAARLPLIAKSGAHNHDYLAAKLHKAGHLF